MALKLERLQNAINEKEQAKAAEENKSWIDSVSDTIENEYDYVSDGIKNNLEWLGNGFNGEMSELADAVATIRDTPLVKLPGAVSDTLVPAMQNVGYALGRDVMKAAEDGSDVAKYIAASNAYNTYLMSPEDKIKKAEEIQNVTGIKTGEILNDSDAYKTALSIYADAKKAQAVMGDQFTMDEVWKQYPTLQNIAELSPDKAALVLHDFANYRDIHGTIGELWDEAWDLGSKRLEFGNLKYKEMNGEATDEDKARMNRLKPQIENSSQREPNAFDDILGYALYTTGSSLPEMMESIHEGTNAAAITAAAGIMAGGAIGAAPGAVVGGAGGAAVGFLRGFLGNIIRKYGLQQAAKVVGVAGMAHGMYKPETGNYYDEYSNMKDSSGKKLLTDEQIAFYAKEAGAANAIIETVSFGAWASAGANALKASKTTTKVVQEGIQAIFQRKVAMEGLKSQRKEIFGIAKNSFSATTKGMFSESFEEGAQSVAEDVVHNQIETATGDTSNGGVYGAKEMAEHAGKAFVAALPSSFLMGAVPNAFGGGAGVYHAVRARNRVSEIDTRYGANAVQTINGARLLGQLQEQVKNSNLSNTSPETLSKIIRDEAAGSGYEMVYVDVPSVLERENGKQDLQEIAKAAGLSDEELQTAISEGGSIAMPLESYAQSSISENTLESVSFSRDAESIAEMKRNAVADAEAMQAEQDKLVELQMKLYDNIPQHYFPEDNNAQEAVRTAITYNPYNPADGLRTYKAQLEQEYYNLIGPALNALQENAGAKNGGGVDVVIIEDDGRSGRGYKISNNAPWYSKFYQDNGRAPTKAEMNHMAEDLTTLSPNMVDVASWRVNAAELSAEEQEALQETTTKLERVKQELADIDRVKSVISKLDKTEVEMIERLSPEGLQVYQAIKKDLQKFGGKVSTAGRVSAVLTARHADLYAAAMRKNGNENYTAMDWYKRMTIGNEEIDGVGYNQPVHPSVDEDGSVNIGLYLPDGGGVVYFNAAEDGNSFTQMAGAKAKTANMEKLNIAKVMSVEGKTAEEIYKATGWLRGKDGKWRFEIPDNLDGVDTEAIKRLKAVPNMSMPLEAIYANPVLFEAYPALADIPVKVAPVGGGTHAQVVVGSWGDTYIVVDEEAASGDSKKLASYLIHEIQHLIQQEEGFASGGSDSKVGETLRKNYISARTKIISDPVKLSYLSAVEKSNEITLRSLMGEDVSEVDIKATQKALDDARAELTDKYGADEEKRLLKISGYAKGLSKELKAINAAADDDKKALAYKAYYRLAGEQEARAAQKRAEYIDAEYNFWAREYKEDMATSLADIQKILSSADDETTKLYKEWNKLLVEFDNLKEGMPEFNQNIDRRSEIEDILSETNEALVEAMNDYSYAYSSIVQNINDKNEYLRDNMPVPHESDAIVVFHNTEYAADMFSQNTNARTTFMSDGSRIVSIFQSADESTFVHEMAHIFLKDLEELAKLDEECFKQLGAVNEWASWDREAIRALEGSSWYKEFVGYHNAIMDAESHGDFRTAAHYKAVWRQERFARGFEMYLRSGEAPVKGLRKVFRDFKKWLISIYSAFLGADKGAAPSPKVKAVMDRMVASEEEIKAAALDDRWKDIEKAGGEKLFNETEEETYQRLLQESQAEAEEKLMKYVMEDMKKKQREEIEQKIQKEIRETTAEMEKVPVYVATRAYERTKDKDIVLQWYPSWEAYEAEAATTEPLEESMKQYEEQMRKLYEEELINSHFTEADIKTAMESSEYYTKRQQMEAVAFTRKMKAVRKVSTKAKLAMQNITDMLDELPDGFDLKEDVTDQRVKDLMDGLNKLRFSEKWEAEAFPVIKAMVNAASKEEVKAGMQKFQELVRQRKINESLVEEATAGRLKGYKESAREYVRTHPLSEACDYLRHIKNEKTMAYRMQTALKTGHYDLAITYKQSMAYSAALADESKKMQEHLDRLIKKVQKQLKARSVKLPKDERYWHAHLAYLLRVTNEDIPVPESGVVDLAQLYQSLVDSLDLQYVPTDIINQATSEDFRGYRSMTIGEFEEAVEALTILYTTGKDKFNMKTIGGKSLEEVKEEITGEAGALALGIPNNRHSVADDEGGLGYLYSLGKIPVIGDKMAQFGQKTLGAVISPENILDIMGDAAKKYIGGIYAKAGDVERTKQVESVKRLQDILSRYTHKERADWKKKKYELTINGDKQILSKENILCMALNYGNDTNWRRLTMGLGDMANINGVRVPGATAEKIMMDNMTTRDWEFVQEIWDYLDSYWKETAEIEEKLNGVALQKVAPRRFAVKPSDSEEKITLRGGYYPIKYNPTKSAKACEQSDITAALRGVSGAQVLGVGRGFTKARADVDIGRPLLLEFGVIEEHVQSVIHNIAYRLAARDVYRIVSSQAVENYMRDTIGANYHKVLKEWATDVWATTKDNNNSANSWLEGAARSLRSNSVMAIMGYRLWPVIENVSNIAVVMDKVGYFGGTAAVLDYYRDFATGFKTYGPLLQKSSFMSNRMNSMDRDIGSRSDLFNAGNPVSDFLKEHAYWLMTKSDLMLSAPLWVKVYKDNIKKEMEKAFKQNEENKKKLAQAQKKLNELKAKRYSITQIISQIDEEKHERSMGILNQGSPFAVYRDYELASQQKQHRETVKNMQKEIWEAEVLLDKAAELEILSDNEVVDRADQNTVLLADKAVKLSFGSGEAQDLSSVQRSRSELTKLMTTFYSFFNTQFNAILNVYLHAKYGHTDVSSWIHFKYYAPVARAYFNRVILASMIGALLKMALKLDGDDDKDKYKKVKNEDGKEVKQEIPWDMRLAKVFAKNVTGTTFGAIPIVRDISNYAVSNIFDGTDYGRGMSFGSTGIKGLESTGKLVKMIAEQSEHNLKIEAKHQRERERFKKMSPKAKKKWLADQKYRKLDKPIENVDIIKAAANTASTFTAARTGVTNTLVDAVTTTMQYMNSVDRYDANLQNIIWSALFDKKPKEKTVPEKPPTPQKKKKK